MAMQNVSMKVEGTKLVITVDLSQEFGLSASSKSYSIATTSGNVSLKSAKADMAALASAGVKVPDNIRIGMNVYRKIGGTVEQAS